MSDRITIRDLENACAALNRATSSPLEFWQDKLNPRNRAINIGHWHIDRAYGGYQLARTCNAGGGVRSYGGHVSARERYTRISAMLDAFHIASMKDNGEI